MLTLHNIRDKKGPHVKPQTFISLLDEFIGPAPVSLQALATEQATMKGMALHRVTRSAA